MTLVELLFRANTKELDNATTKVENLGKSAAKAGNTEIKPIVDTSSLDAGGTKLAGFGLAMGGIVAAATAVGAGLGKLAMDAIEAADNLRDLSLRTNISIERLSVLGETAKISGGSLEEMVDGSEALSKRLARQDSESGKASKALEILGVTTKDTAGIQKSALQLQEDIIVAAGQATDKQGAEAAAVAVLGAGYYRLRGVVLETKNAKEEMYDLMSRTGGVVTTDLANRSDNLNDKLGSMKTVFGGIGNSIATVALPALDKVASIALSTATAVAEAIARITGTEKQSTMADRQLEKIQRQKKLAEDLLAKSSPDFPGRSALEEQVQRYTEAERLVKKWGATAITTEAAVKKAATTGTAGEGASTASGVGPKDDDGKKAREEAEKNEKWRAEQAAKRAKAIIDAEEEANKYAEKLEEKQLEEAKRTTEALNQKADAIRSQIDPNFQVIEQLKLINELELKGHLTELEAAKARLETQKQLTDTADTFSAGWGNAFREYQNQAMTAADAGREAFAATTNAMTSGIQEFVTTGKINFKEFARSVIADLAQIYAKMLATKLVNYAINAFSGGANPVAGGTGFGDYNTLASPEFRANGGPTLAGQSYIVGEKGPELLRMGSMGGYVTPNAANDSGTSGVQIGSIVITIEGGQTNEETAGRMRKELLETMKDVADSRISEATRSGGILRRN